MLIVVGGCRAFAGTKARLMHEQFVELFDTDLVTLPQVSKYPLTSSTLDSKPQTLIPDNLFQSAPSWFVDYHLVDPRQEQITRENLESQLRAIEVRSTPATLNSFTLRPQSFIRLLLYLVHRRSHMFRPSPVSSLSAERAL
jgi:hypothetical protein